MALICKDKIEVETSHGLCQVELLYGSITKIDRNDPVDVLVVSAFPGDYSATPTSVIGALWRDLKVKVRDLAKDKEEDLRSLFSCWWSKPLSASLKLPFKRLMCFEGGFKRGKRPPSVVGEVFRSLVSLCKDTDVKVIMPLLAAGDQGYSQQMMLGLIVDAAIHWMQIGLPLRSLKIVIYCRDPLNSDIANDPLLLRFHDLKSKWLQKMAAKSTQQSTVKYDVYLSYCPTEESLGESVRKRLVGSRKHLKIFAGKQEIDANESWQEEMYKVMVSCARVVTLLTPEFLKNTSCIEQYNIALCCTRTMKRDYLAPLYILDIDHMPTYMCLIQYVDCRPRDEIKIESACSQLSTWLSTPPADTQPVRRPQLARDASLDRATYEVFISYAHVDAEVAERMKTYLHQAFPHWRIFIDTAALQAGNSWQVTLYNSIESSKVVIALISGAYISSKICQEEFNLGSLLHRDALYNTFLLPVLIENCQNLPLWCRARKPISGLNLMLDEAIASLVPMLEAYVNQYDRKAISGDIEADHVLSEWRSAHIQKGMPFLPNLHLSETNTQTMMKSQSHDIDVYLSYHEKDKDYADYFVSHLKRYSEGVIISEPDGKSVRLGLLDKARIIVSLISSDYLDTSELFEELNIGMCRHRYGNHMTVIPILLEPLRSSPAFVHLLCTLFACEDPCWQGAKVPLFDSTISFRKAACLHATALTIARFLADPSLCDGQFKTLVSLEEIEKSLRLLKKDDYSVADFHPIKFVSVGPMSRENGDQETKVESSKDSYPENVKKVTNDSQTTKTLSLVDFKRMSVQSQDELGTNVAPTTSLPVQEDDHDAADLKKSVFAEDVAANGTRNTISRNESQVVEQKELTEYLATSSASAGGGISMKGDLGNEKVDAFESIPLSTEESEVKRRQPSENDDNSVYVTSADGKIENRDVMVDQASLKSNSKSCSLL